jgi:Uncharacterized protein conserved in bacteria (DUF2330)
MADGKVFRPVAVAADVTIPDQRALIHFTNGVERLVIETRFTGSGTNFAWVIPLPSQPVIEEATTGLFPTLQYLFQPRITHNVTRYYLGILFLMLIGYLFRLTTRSVWSAFVIAVFLLVLAFVTMMLPALSRAGGKGMASVSSGQNVSILERRLVGIFETTTITSRDPEALGNWLRDNGFAISTNAAVVIESYVKDGWVFVAARVRRDKAENETSTPHPLSFTFKTDKPVYPMRLTGVDNGPLRVELYVFGPSRAIAPHFKVERCTRPNYSESPARWSGWSPGTPDIVHPLLRKWVDGSPVVTKLTATLSPTDMRKDVWLDWAHFSEKRNIVFSRQGALTYALNVGAIVFGVGLFATGIIAFGSDRPPRWLRKLTAGSLLLGVLLVGAVYLYLPKTEVRLVRFHLSSSEYALFELYSWLEDTKEVATADIRAEAIRVLSNPTNDDLWAKHASSFLKEPINNLVGGQIHEEDSPGNYTLSETNGLLLFRTYDAQGAGHVLGNWILQTNH